MSEKKRPPEEPVKRGHSLPLIGGLLIFTVVLGTTDIGFIPVPTEAQNATTMHLPTIVASILEGWPIGMVVGFAFGGIAMYTPGSPMGSDPMVALAPRLLVGVTPYFTYVLLKGRNEYLRLGTAAVVGTFTNTIGFLSIAVLKGYLTGKVALSIAIKHGIPEAVVAVVVTIPAIILLRKAKAYFDTIGQA